MMFENPGLNSALQCLEMCARAAPAAIRLLGSLGHLPIFTGATGSYIQELL